MEALQAKLRSSDAYEQSYNRDAVAEAYTLWYAKAKEFAKGELAGGEEEMTKCTVQVLKMMLSTYKLDVVRDPASDEYAIREAHGTVHKIFDIHEKKPKFTVLLQNRAIWDYLSLQGLSDTQDIAYHDSVPPGIAAAAFQTIHSMLNLAAFCMKTFPVVYKGSPIAVNTTLLARAAARPSMDSVVRQEALSAIQAAAFNGANTKAVLSMTQYAQDSIAFTPIWSMGALGSLECLNLLLKRIKSQRDTVLPIAVLESLYEAVVNSNTSSHYIDVNRNDENLFKVDEQQPAICEVIQACSQVILDLQNRDEKAADSLLPDVYAQLVESLLKRDPSCTLFLHLALSNITASSVSMLVGISESFEEPTWLGTLLPFLRKTLATMSLSGVSGEQLDQEVINLLREVCRVYYINHDRLASTELGYNVFFTIVQAMRHGYFETERFTEILAMVVVYHLKAGQMDALQWLPHMLLPSISHNYKTTKAIHEALMIICGLETSSFGVETSSSVRINDHEVIEMVCIALSPLRTNAADEFWKNLFLNFGHFVDGQPKASVKLLHSIKCEVDSMIKAGAVDLTRIASLTELLSAIVIHGLPDHQLPFLFELTVKAMVLHPDGASLYSQDMLAKIVQDVEAYNEPSKLSQYALMEALAYFGPRLRVSIARIAPHLCLADQDAQVRATAMESMLSRDFKHLIASSAGDIFQACDYGTIVERPSEDGSEKIGLQSFMLGSALCPLLAELCIQNPRHLGECVLRILSTETVCAENNLMHEPIQVTAALDRIAEYVPSDHLKQFLRSMDGNPLFSALSRLSGNWNTVVNSLGSEKDMDRAIVIEFEADPVVLKPLQSTERENLWDRIRTLGRNPTSSRRSQVSETILTLDVEMSNVLDGNSEMDQNQANILLSRVLTSDAV